MGKGLIVVLVLVGLFVVFVGSVVIGGFSFYTEALKQENGIKYQYSQNQNSYDNYFKKLREAAQVPEMYVADLRKLYDDVMRGRYGEGGSKAVFQWIQEKNPNVSPKLYVALQRIIDAGRNKFEADQKMLLDKKLAYENYLIDGVWHRLYAGFLGFPKIDLSKYDIVTSDETQKAFDTKKSDPLRLRGNE